MIFRKDILVTTFNDIKYTKVDLKTIQLIEIHTLSYTYRNKSREYFAKRHYTTKKTKILLLL